MSADLFIVRTMHDVPGKCIASSRRGSVADCPNRSTRVVLYGTTPMFALCEAHAHRVVAGWDGAFLGPELPPFDLTSVQSGARW